MPKSVRDKVDKFIDQCVKDLNKAFSYLKNGKGIELEDDVFLVEGGLDGSDKCYGFFKENDRIFVVTRGCSGGYPISDMEYEDLDYMFNLSNVFEKIKKKKYPIVNSDEI